MQVVFENIGLIELTIDIKHKGMDELRPMDLKAPSDTPLNVTKGMTLTVSMDADIHREHESPIEYLLIKYAGVEYKVVPKVAKQGTYQPVLLFDGDKDFWTNVLRNKCKSI